MNSNKPEITSLASASFLIQGHPKATASAPDSVPIPDCVTVAAYEADE